jgi:acetolactate synthase small subunit
MLRELKGIQAELKMRLALAVMAPPEQRAKQLDSIEQEHSVLDLTLERVLNRSIQLLHAQCPL